MIPWALYSFVFLGLFSPGPNVILLTTSGARFGLKATLPHVFGVVVGVGITSSLAGFGIGTALGQLPWLALVLKCVAAGWILFMAYKLWHSAPPRRETSTERPFTFVEAVLFQWVNPKVWAVALSATAYTNNLPAIEQAFLLGTAFSGLNLVVCLFWSTTGSLLSNLLNDQSKWRIFARGMAIALVVFSVLVFL